MISFSYLITLTLVSSPIKGKINIFYTQTSQSEYKGEKGCEDTLVTIQCSVGAVQKYL